MLILAGLGIGDELSITLEEINEAKRCDKIYIEFYTNVWNGNLENLENIIGKNIEVLKRKDLEENSSKIIEEAIEKDVIIFIPGDPLVATTHISLIIDSIKRGVKYRILHNSSIISAIFETGIHTYKIGGIVTIPFKEKFSKKPSHIIKTIKRNLKNKLHTICLLDIDLENNRMMSLKEALEFLIKYVGLDKNYKIVVASNLGKDSRKIIFNSIEKLMNIDLDKPITIVIPGELHFTEEEFLNSISL